MRYQPPVPRDQASIEELFQEGHDIIHSASLLPSAKLRELEAITKDLYRRVGEDYDQHTAQLKAETKEAIRKSSVQLP